MRLFVLEYLTSGLEPETTLSPSLLREGGAMLSSLMSDIARLPEIDCMTLLSSQGKIELPGQITVAYSNDSAEALSLFDQLLQQAEQVLIIAPESDGVLLDLYGQVEQAGKIWLGCSREAIQVTADKFSFYERLKQAGLPVVETTLVPLQSNDLFEPDRFPVVMKPRDGAGGESTWLIHDAKEFQSHNQPKDMMIQPYCSGLPCSVAVLSHDSQNDIFPVGKQLINWHQGFHYSGGELPLNLTPTDRDQLHDLLKQIQSILPGLYGYWGMDFIWNRDSGVPIQIVEINPRLTTSYLGYHRLTSENLAERWLLPDSERPAIQWHNGPITFGKEL